MTSGWSSSLLFAVSIPLFLVAASSSSGSDPDTPSAIDADYERMFEGVKRVNALSWHWDLCAQVRLGYYPFDFIPRYWHDHRIPHPSTEFLIGTALLAESRQIGEYYYLVSPVCNRKILDRIDLWNTIVPLVINPEGKFSRLFFPSMIADHLIPAWIRKSSTTEDGQDADEDWEACRDIGHIGVYLTEGMEIYWKYLARCIEQWDSPKKDSLLKFLPDLNIDIDSVMEKQQDKNLSPRGLSIVASQWHIDLPDLESPGLYASMNNRCLIFQVMQEHTNPGTFAMKAPRPLPPPIPTNDGPPQTLKRKQSPSMASDTVTPKKRRKAHDPTPVTARPVSIVPEESWLEEFPLDFGPFTEPDQLKVFDDLFPQLSYK